MFTGNINIFTTGIKSHLVQSTFSEQSGATVQLLRNSDVHYFHHKRPLLDHSIKFMYFFVISIIKLLNMQLVQ
jgi:hypothetical protein